MRTNILKEQMKYTLHFWNKRYILLCDLFTNLREVLCMLEDYIIQKNNYLYVSLEIYTKNFPFLPSKNRISHFRISTIIMWSGLNFLFFGHCYYLSSIENHAMSILFLLFMKCYNMNLSM